MTTFNNGLCSLRRMPEGQPLCVQCDTMPEARRGTVPNVTQDRMADVRQLYANLMLATGQRFDFDQTPAATRGRYAIPQP